MKRYFNSLKCDPFTIIVLSIVLSIILTSCDPNQGRVQKGFRDSEKWGKVITRDIQLDDFTMISNYSIADIIFTQSDTVRYTIEGNEKAFDHFKFTVDYDSVANCKRLVVDSPKTYSGPSIRLYISAPTLDVVYLWRYGDFDIKDSVSFDDLFLTNHGNGNIDISHLNAKKLVLTIGGYGDINIRHLTCNALDATIHGFSYGGDIKIRDAKVDTYASLVTMEHGNIDADITAQKIIASTSDEGDVYLKVDCDTLSIQSSACGDVEVEGQTKVLKRFRRALGTTNAKRLHADKIEWEELE